MKIQVFPSNSPDQINLDYMIDVRFDDKRIIQCNVIAAYKPDVTNPLNAIRVAIGAELMEDIPLGDDLKPVVAMDKIIDMIEQQGGVWTPQSLQFWPQYIEQPVEIRKMPQYALILQKIKVDAVASFMAFMKDKQEFHVFAYGSESAANQDESDWMLNLPEIETPNGRGYLARLYWGDQHKKLLMIETINMVTMETNALAIEQFDLEPLCAAADLIQYWLKTIEKLS